MMAVFIDLPVLAGRAMAETNMHYRDAARNGMDAGRGDGPARRLGAPTQGAFVHPSVWREGHLTRRTPDMRGTLLGAMLVAVATAGGAHEASAAEAAIADNSFLIEEAYNQEARVVQHIQTLSFTGESWDDVSYGFTQEWPLGGERHQLSVTVPVERSAGEKTALGDVLLNYRLQLGGGGRPWALAPRLSAILPTAGEGRGLDDGAPGLQVNLPASATLGPRAIGHLNAGVTILPGATSRAGEEETLADYHLGASVIAPGDRPLQFLLEGVLDLEEAAGAAERVSTWTASPGVRAAWNRGDAQIVPGFALPVSWTEGANGSKVGLFFYLSIEHPF
ncbi:MAG: transporter [Candidatus Latescibacterota bacterium]